MLGLTGEVDGGAEVSEADRAALAESVDEARWLVDAADPAEVGACLEGERGAAEAIEAGDDAPELGDRAR